MSSKEKELFEELEHYLSQPELSEKDKAFLSNCLLLFIGFISGGYIALYLVENSELVISFIQSQWSTLHYIFF